MTERREPGAHCAIMFSLKLVAFVSGLSITLFVQHTETYVRSPVLQRSQLKQRLTVFAKIVEFPWAYLCPCPLLRRYFMTVLKFRNYKDFHGKPCKRDWMAKVVFLIQMLPTFGRPLQSLLLRYTAENSQVT